MKFFKTFVFVALITQSCQKIDTQAVAVQNNQAELSESIAPSIRIAKVWVEDVLAKDDLFDEKYSVDNLNWRQSRLLIII